MSELTAPRASSRLRRPAVGLEDGDPLRARAPSREQARLPDRPAPQHEHPVIGSDPAAPDRAIADEQRLGQGAGVNRH
jgi:hypothetical protein